MRPTSEPPKSMVAGRGQRLEGALDDALGADVLPRAGGVLGEHGEVLVLQLVEDRPRGLHDVGVGHHHARGQAVGAEDGNRHAGLDGQGLVVLQVQQGIDDGVVRFPVAGALADPAIDDQTLGLFSVLHVVFEHAQQRFLLPALAAERGPALRFDRIEDVVFHGCSLRN